MTSTDNASKQLHPYLPGLEPPAGPKLPHQMSPEEFESAPNAVFHSTQLPEESVRDLSNSGLRKKNFDSTRGYSPHMHVGSEQAALERAASASKVKYGDTRLYSYWYQGSSNDPTEVHEDRKLYTTHGVEGDSSYTHDLHPFGAVLYSNKDEDRGSVSISIADPSRVKSQEEYVKEAIAAGKAHEVHPKTLAHYHAGILGKRVVTRAEGSAVLAAASTYGPIKSVLPGMPINPDESVIRTDTTGMYTGGEDVREPGWAMPVAPAGGAAVQTRKKPSRVSEKGPDKDYILTQAKAK